MTDLSRPVWRRSSRSSSSGGQCVEVALTKDAVGVRDSKDRQGPVLAFDPAAFAAFVTSLKSS